VAEVPKVPPQKLKKRKKERYGGISRRPGWHWVSADPAYHSGITTHRTQVVVDLSHDIFPLTSLSIHLSK
jgi:hypothetical protein